MGDLPGPGLEPMSPALAGGFLTTAPPGKSQEVNALLNLTIFDSYCHIFLQKRLQKYSDQQRISVQIFLHHQQH